MSWLDTIKKRIKQVDPFEMLTSQELAHDLGPHLLAEPFFVPQDDLDDFLESWYDEMAHEKWTQKDLARMIIRHFNLREGN